MPWHSLNLPNELVVQCLECLCESDGNDAKRLFPLLTVCKTINDIAEPLLLRRLQLDAISILPVTGSLLFTAKARHIRTLIVSLAENEALGISSIDCRVAFGVLQFLIDQADHLDSLQLTFKGDWMDSDPDIDFKALFAPFSHLHFLRHFHLWAEPARLRMHSWEVINSLGGSRNLRSFWSVAFTDYMNSRIPLPAFPCLESLTLGLVSVGQLETYFTAMPSLLHLDILSFLVTCPHVTLDFCQRHFGRLRRLHIAGTPEYDGFDLVNLLCCMPRLLVLQLGIPGSSDTGFAFRDEDIAALPMSLKKITLYDARLNLMILANHVKHEMPALQTMVLQAPGPLQDILMSQHCFARVFLEAVCSQRGIQLQYLTSRAELHYKRAVATEGGMVE